MNFIHLYSLNVNCIQVVDFMLDLTAVISGQKQWIWSRFNYHPNIVSKPTKQVN